MKFKSFIISLLLPAFFTPALAQRKVSADVEVKTVVDGIVSTVTKSVYCSNNGRLVTLFKTPAKFYLVTNSKGEAQIYKPDTNETISQTDPSMSSSADLVSLFMNGRIDDLGLGWYGYKLSSSSKEDEYTKKTFKPSDPSLPVVEIVFENFLPIYAAYKEAGGKILSKKYLSNYKTFKRFVMPLRVVDISYDTARDSSVTRTIYSSVKVDEDDPNFNFTVPSDAKPVQIPVPGAK